jgi:hypothetical protein
LLVQSNIAKAGCLSIHFAQILTTLFLKHKRFTVKSESKCGFSKEKSTESAICLPTLVWWPTPQAKRARWRLAVVNVADVEESAESVPRPETDHVEEDKIF